MLALAPDGTLYLADNYYRIRYITPDGIINTLYRTSDDNASIYMIWTSVRKGPCTLV